MIAYLLVLLKSPMDLVNAFFRKYYPASAQHVALQRIFNFKQIEGRENF